MKRRILALAAFVVGFAVAASSPARAQTTFRMAFVAPPPVWGPIAEHYGEQVLVVEYRTQDFRYSCRHWGPKLPIVLRDLALSPKGIHRYC